jgi:hypothetical protein
MRMCEEEMVRKIFRPRRENKTGGNFMMRNFTFCSLLIVNAV